jgi:pimeloyl-ACP methyl ester carboxylesterase
VTLFIDLRATPSGGICAAEATLWEDGTQLLPSSDLGSRVRGRDVILATHGFNVNREHGIKALTQWISLNNVSPSNLFVGVLWPGDSRYLPVLDYPVEGEEAILSGRLLAGFINQFATDAASISLVSHSLGARMVLETLQGLNLDVRRLIMMAGAIEDDCLTNEYHDAAAKAQKIYVLASKADWVLELAFPIGNPAGEIVMRGHPYFRTALGREGPARPIPLVQRGGAWQIPDGWGYGHLDYLPGKAIAPAIPPPIDVPAPDAAIPSNPPVAGWKSSWSAGVVSTQLR